MSFPSPPSTAPISHFQAFGKDTRLQSGNGSETGRRGSVGNGGSGTGGRPDKPLAHLKDLQDRSTEGLNPNQSIGHLVKTAEASLQQAQALLDFRKPDLAYLEYLRTYEILVNFVQQHASYTDFKTAKGPLHQKYWALVRSLNDCAEQFEKVKTIIINDNKRNETQTRLPSALTPGPQRFSASALSSPPQVPVSKFARPLSLPDSSNIVNGKEASSIPSTRSQMNLASPPKPTPSPKPKALHGHVIGANGASNQSAEALNERFARLRMGAIDTGLTRSDSRSSTHSIQTSPTTMSSPTDYNSRASLEALDPVTSNSSIASKPYGPRPMQNGKPLKLPFGGLSLDAQVAAAMPKPPSPTYSPARNMQTPGNVDPPRSTARSIVGTGGRSNSVASVASSHAPGGSDVDGYFPAVAPSPTSARSSLKAQRRRKSVYLPREIRVGAEKLYDYLKMHNILMIDVRNREAFDEGHIFAHSVICIEPAALHRDMSADELQDRLVLSPEMEQDMFFNRDKYDLVVYYDEATVSDQYLHHPKNEHDLSLRYLHDALYEFNQDKPLQRPPILLMGGIRAWADLVGSQALQMSSTARSVKNSRPIRRVPAPTGKSRLQIPKKRLRDYNPLDAEEEQKWRERARVESVAVEAKAEFDEEDENAVPDDADMENIEDFNRRFPDAGALARQAGIQTYAQPPRVPPKIPQYPAAPPPSSVPQIPKRPAPAAPRMSYSGVNERTVSQSSQKSVELPAYVPLRYLPSNLRLPKTGLVNFGVTCYMNATIQALSATTPLSVFFMDDRYRSQVQFENWKGSKGVLPDLYANLVRSIWKGDVEAIRPSTLRQFCARLNKEWGIDRQQDAKEFFDFIVDCLHEDLNGNWSRTPLRALTTEQEVKRERMPKLVVSKKEWERYTHREQSYLTSLFAGQHASRLRCTTCHFTSTTYEAFYSISVEIPHSGKGNIQDCLKSYCAEEMLSGDEVWKCPQCNKEREATKQITITRAPQFLVVHFKRFSAGRGESARKVRTPIEFPLHNMDLEPYMLPSPTPIEAQTIARDYGAQELKSDPPMTPPYTYDAYAVMRHIGTTLTSGHYTCLARDRARSCWRHFNDTNIGDFDPERLPERDRLQNEMAYIVFYQRVGDK